MIAKVLGLSLMSTVAAFSFFFIFPQGEQWISDWQMARMVSGTVDPSIVLVKVQESESSALCGEGKWNLNRLEATLLALHEAGAAVVAPSIENSMPLVSECGGLAGLVRLAEATKRAGAVVYPETVPLPLAEAAAALGTMGLKHDKDGVFRRFQFFPSAGDSAYLSPFGLAVVSIGSKKAMDDSSIPSGRPLRFVGRWQDAPFPTHTFADVWNLIQARDLMSLTKMFQGKRVFLFVVGDGDRTVLTPWEPSVPREFLHALLANAILTGEWISMPPIWVAFLVTIGFCILLAFFMLQEFSVRRLVLVGSIGILLLGMLALYVGRLQGWVWPILTTGLALGLTLGGTIVWRSFISRSDIQKRITEGDQQLQQLERELTVKQDHVRNLSMQLHSAQDRENQSATAIEELQVSQSLVCRQLEVSQAEIEDTRRQIHRLQEELAHLRPQIPATEKAFRVPPIPVESQALLDECASYGILTRDPAVLRVFQDLKKAAVTHNPILLLGETGTGKEVLAQAAHVLSPRRAGPFVSVNMAAIRAELFEGELFGHVRGAFTGAVGRKGYIEAASGGTLFLDEVGELPRDLQAKLLRFLEDGSFYRVGESRLTRVDVRIIAATNRNLQKDVEEGRYREDLYYRLRNIVLHILPLRQRKKEDRLLLAQSFLQDFSRQQQREDLAFTQGTLRAIETYAWPGNIRELRQTVGQAVALVNGPLITEEDLHLSDRKLLQEKGKDQQKETWGHPEDSGVLECLRQNRFDMQATARALEWDRSTVTQRLKGLGFQALVTHQGNIKAAARALAGDTALVRVVEGRLREYSNNLLPPAKHYATVEEAVADCRKRFRNLPERHFPAVEQLIHLRFSTPD